MRVERSGRFRCIREIRVPTLNLDASPTIPRLASQNVSRGLLQPRRDGSRHAELRT
jgi:hypothetical protein